MKAFEMELGELFDFEGLISIILLVPMLFLCYYQFVYPSLSRTHYEEIFQQANGNVAVSAEKDTFDCGFMEAVNNNTKTIQPLPNAATQNSADGKKPSIDLTIRAPKYFSSFIDTHVEMQIKNKTQQLQRGRVILYNQVVKSSGTEVKKLNTPAWVQADATSANYIDYDVPPCATESYSFNAHTPRIEDGSMLLLWFGFYSCPANEECNNEKTVNFIRWNDSLKAGDCRTILDDEMIQYVCIPSNINAALQHSAREKLLFSPWSNAFLPILTLIVVAVFDRLFGGLGSGPRGVSTILQRTLAIVLASSFVFVGLAWMLIKFDLIQTIQILLMIAVAVLILAANPLQLLARMFRYQSIHFSVLACMLKDEWHPRKWKENLGKKIKKYFEGIESGKDQAHKKNGKTIFKERSEALENLRACASSLETLGLQDTRDQGSPQSESNATQLNTCDNEDLILFIQKLVLTKRSVETCYAPGEHRLKASSAQQEAVQAEMDRLEKLYVKKLLPELVQRHFKPEQDERIAPLLYELCLSQSLKDYYLNNLITNVFTHKKEVEKNQNKNGSTEPAGVDGEGTAPPSTPITPIPNEQ